MTKLYLTIEPLELSEGLKITVNTKKKNTEHIFNDLTEGLIFIGYSISKLKEDKS